MVTSDNLSSAHSSLLDWWLKNRREFPWRETSNAFHILISEVMLQRTRADQVVSVYTTFINQFPDPESIIDASEGDLREALFSLGLPQRIHNIRAMSHQIVDDFNGVVPGTYLELRKLRGVGDYIASAICCFGYNHPVIVVDTNTVRIVGRVFGIATDPESRRKKIVREKHQFLLNIQNPRAHNYALLDLAAMICLPNNPNCTECPLLTYCKFGTDKLSSKEK